MPRPPSSPPVRHHISTTSSLLRGYSSLSVPALLAPLTPDFTHRVLPSSLRVPPHDIDAFAAHARSMFSLFRRFEMVPVEVFEDVDQDAVVILARMEGETKGGEAWENECVLVVKLTEDGRGVREVVEFVDGGKAGEMRGRFGPEGFGPVGGGGRGVLFGLGWVGGLVLFLGVAGGTMVGVRRWLLRD
ncbi:hypothetical protein QBC39DRAFT_375062 [Podospora conica]|nr:hypothetical protein QBC39DRAFT_375062 [Schizothecium conicum]